ncbi:MAG: large-conductance mechanosensitive channel protein MscL [Oscillospiraceae bacterium]|nr:large-conductance mechanosensitive channel protein MscL [Oscillospiraceae bacterium]
MAENENQSVVKKKLKGVGGVINEFKTFISRGNVLDMAVGVIVGGAFTSIVNSLVDDILMPFIGMILAGINFRSLGVTIPWGNRPYINIGNFLQAIITFILTAMCVFFIVKFMNVFHKKEEPKKEPEKEEPKPSNEELLLMEIRDLLKEKQ